MKNGRNISYIIRKDFSHCKGERVVNHNGEIHVAVEKICSAYIFRIDRATSDTKGIKLTCEVVDEVVSRSVRIAMAGPHKGTGHSLGSSSLDVWYLSEDLCVSCKVCYMPMSDFIRQACIDLGLVHKR